MKNWYIFGNKTSQFSVYIENLVNCVVHAYNLIVPTSICLLQLLILFCRIENFDENLIYLKHCFMFLVYKLRFIMTVISYCRQELCKILFETTDGSSFQVTHH